MLIAFWNMWNRFIEVFKVEPEEEYLDMIPAYVDSLPAPSRDDPDVP